jgi:hypothetical protein
MSLDSCHGGSGVWLRRKDGEHGESHRHTHYGRLSPVRRVWRRQNRHHSVRTAPDSWLAQSKQNDSRNDFCVTRDATVTDPRDGSTLTCEQVDFGGRSGMIEPGICPLIPGQISSICGWTWPRPATNHPLPHRRPSRLDRRRLHPLWLPAPFRLAIFAVPT